MKRFFVSAALTAAMFVSAPLTAQPYNGYGNGGWNSNEFWRGAPNNTWERMRFLQNRIDRGLQDGSLTPSEARRAQWQLRRIRQDASRMRHYNGTLSPSDAAVIQARLDDLSRKIRWARHNGNWAGGGYPGGYQGGYGGDVDYSRYRTDYDAAHYYRDGPQYQERRLSSTDYVYRGSDGRYYCKRSDGTTGLIVGAVAGGILGSIIAPGDSKPLGAVIGAIGGGAAGAAIDSNNPDVRCQ